MLTGDGNEKCNKKSIGLKSEKKVCTCSTFFCTFLCHCFAVRLQRTLDFLVARFWRKNRIQGGMFLRSIFFFFSLPLILTLLAANICHFLFLFFFLFCFVSFALAFSLLSVSV